MNIWEAFEAVAEDPELRAGAETTLGTQLEIKRDSTGLLGYYRDGENMGRFPSTDWEGWELWKYRGTGGWEEVVPVDLVEEEEGEGGEKEEEDGWSYVESYRIALRAVLDGKQVETNTGEEWFTCLYGEHEQLQVDTEEGPLDLFVLAGRRFRYRDREDQWERCSPGEAILAYEQGIEIQAGGVYANEQTFGAVVISSGLFRVDGITITNPLTLAFRKKKGGSK